MLRELLERIKQGLLFFGVSVAEADEDDDDQEDQEDQDDSDASDDQEEEDAEEDSDSDEDKADDESDDSEDKEDDAEEPKVKMYPQETVTRLRNEAKSRRQKQRAAEDREKAAQAEIRDLKKGRTAASTKKKAADDSRLAEEIEEQREAIAELTRERDELAEVQTLTDRVLIIGKVANELGFMNASDAVAFLSTKSEDYTNADGEVDTDALQTTLEELLEEKPYLAGQAVQEKQVKTKKARSEASKTGNPSEKQKIDAQDVRQGASKSTEEADKKIREHLNKNHDGRAALKVFLAEKYLPGTQKDRHSVS